MVGGILSNSSLSEKIDIYALGNIFFRIIAGHDPWKEYKIDGRINLEDQDSIAKRKRDKGDIPVFLDNPKMATTSDPAIKAIRDIMMKCFRLKPEDRPTAIEIERELDEAYVRLTMHKKKPK